MISVFVDTDVCLDLLTGRQPFNKVAEQLFSLADDRRIQLYVSALSFANIDYILKSELGAGKARNILARFKTLVTVVAVDDKTIDLAIASEFNDFEDGIQHYCATEAGVSVLLTRNIRDYRKAVIPVTTPEIFMKRFSGD